MFPFDDVIMHQFNDSYINITFLDNLSQYNQIKAMSYNMTSTWNWYQLSVVNKIFPLRKCMMLCCATRLLYHISFVAIIRVMMTSSNGNIFRFTGHLWRRALMFSLICTRLNGWVNNREAGDFRRHPTQYDAIVMVVATKRIEAQHISPGDKMNTCWNQHYCAT